MKVKVYSTPTCPYCTMVKVYLSSKGIDFQQFDVSSDKNALEEMAKLSGQMGVPVVSINDQVVVGFDRSRIDSLLDK